VRLVWTFGSGSWWGYGRVGACVVTVGTVEELIDPVPVGQEVGVLLGGELIARSAEVNVDHFALAKQPIVDDYDLSSG